MNVPTPFPEDGKHVRIELFKDEARERPPNGAATVELVSAESIIPQPIEWTWPGWLARGRLHILAGQPGAGKTTLALEFAAIISSGGVWPDGARAKLGSVVIWSGEDDPADTLVPRLLAAGANLQRVHFVHGVREDGRSRAFDPARDMLALEAAVRRVGDVRLVVIDPIALEFAAIISRQLVRIRRWNFDSGKPH